VELTLLHWVGCSSFQTPAHRPDGRSPVNRSCAWLAGSDDGNAPDVLSELSTRLPDATFAVVPNAGDISNIEGSAHFTPMLAKFLDSHTNGATR
jgi:hypothetical protein